MCDELYRHMYPTLPFDKCVIYLSIDIGIRNFAYCLAAMYNNTVTLLQWENMDLLTENHITKSARNVRMTQFHTVLDQSLQARLPCWRLAHRVLVEQQIGHSRNAKLEGMVCMWLHLRLQKPIQHVSPRQKLAIDFATQWMQMPKPDSQVYAQRKAYTINVVTKWVQTQPKWVRDYFLRQGKQDDLADVLLQVVAVHIKTQK